MIKKFFMVLIAFMVLIVLTLTLVKIISNQFELKGVVSSPLEVYFSNAQDVSVSNDFFFDVSRGVTSLDSVFKFGRNPSISATPEVVWDGEGDYVFLNSSETLTIVSTSSLDNYYTNGSGARVVVVYGLDDDFNEISEVVLLNGTTPVVTSQSFRRTFRALVLYSGTDNPISDANKGDLTFTSSDSSILQAKILVNNGQTLMAVYTVPACKNGYVTGVGASVPNGKDMLLKYKVRNAEQDLNGAFSVKYTVDLFQQAIVQELKVPLKLPPKTDVAVTGVSSAGTSVSASFGLILEDVVGCVS